MDMNIFSDQPFNDKNSFLDFLLANALAHSQIAKELEQQGHPIQSQPLGDMTNEDDWLSIHWDVHSEELSAFGIKDMGVDLSDVDLHDETQYRDWMHQHALIHQSVNSALGLI